MIAILKWILSDGSDSIYEIFLTSMSFFFVANPNKGNTELVAFTAKQQTETFSRKLVSSTKIIRG